MKLTTARLAELSDMLCLHICMRRHSKALLIAQYLRKVSGYHMLPFRTIDIYTGHRIG
jgi:hypothetical protein